MVAEACQGVTDRGLCSGRVVRLSRPQAPLPRRQIVFGQAQILQYLLQGTRSDLATGMPGYRRLSAPFRPPPLLMATLSLTVELNSKPTKLAREFRVFQASM